MAIDVFKSQHNLLPKVLNSYFNIRHHKINMRGNGSYVFLSRMLTETGKCRLLTKGHVFIIDWKNPFVMKHQSYYSKRNCNYLRLCELKGSVLDTIYTFILFPVCF